MSRELMETLWEMLMVLRDISESLRVIAERHIEEAKAP